MLNHFPAESVFATLGVSEEIEVTGYLVMTVEETSEEYLTNCEKHREVWPCGWDGGFTRDSEDRVTETREVDHPDKEEGDLLALLYPHWIILFGFEFKSSSGLCNYMHLLH